MKWYKLTPVDTLFFKGAEPMKLGENHTASHLFPPPAHTLSGALRTGVLSQNLISIEDYAGGKAPAEIYDAIGRPGYEAPFSLVGPLFIYGNDLYLPAPYSWFMERDGGNGKTRVIKGTMCRSRLLRSAADGLIWAKGEREEVVSLGGMWIKWEDLYTEEPLVEIRKCDDFFEDEPRTGIALQRDRRVREGYLYSFNHVRLKRDVGLVFGTDSELPLKSKGVLKVGGEQRLGWYEEIFPDMKHLPDQADLYMSLSILEGTKEVNEAVVATGKVQYLGGWDLHTGFHKPMKGFFPAGTVLTKKINNNFTAIRR